MSEVRILQVLPADNWFAMYEEDESIVNYPLVCWAFTEKVDFYVDGEQCIRGMDGEEYVDFCDLATNFVGYKHRSSLKKEKS